MKLSTLLTASLVASAAAFAPQPSVPRAATQLAASPLQNKISAATAAIATASLPFIALAVEDDYEYGAVDAPIGIAVGAGVLAIATALLPVLLSPGEEAFEEMRDRDSASFGSRDNKDVLNKRK